MIDSTQRTFIRHYIVYHALDLICEFLNKSDNALMSLVSPEDTTENAAERQLQIVKYDGIDILGVIKAVFWVTVSITLSLLIGKLN